LDNFYLYSDIVFYEQYIQVSAWDHNSFLDIEEDQRDGD